MLQVQVRDWGSGDPGDLGELRVASVSSSSPTATEPLYQQLARRLETLEARFAFTMLWARDAVELQHQSG